MCLAAEGNGYATTAEKMRAAESKEKESEFKQPLLLLALKWLSFCSTLSLEKAGGAF